ncbi:MAG: cobalamin B12-binding domain-containing protein [Verrucomicrobia bacterium]|nr:cobalamin B12-binding domain-containing protein [Verrucomicrobiota bacterium]
MASKILLISVNTCRDPYPVFPLGLGYVDAALRTAGHATRWLDVQTDGQPLAEVLSEFRPDFIGLSLRNIDDVVIKKRETYFDGLSALCQEIRRLTASPIIVGGSGFSIFPAELLARSGADFGIQGEGERSLVALVTALERGGDWTRIPGLVHRRDGQIICNPQQAGAPLDELAPPVRPARLAEFYLSKSSMLNVQTQRGCAFHCCYCTYPLIEGRAYRRRGPVAVAEELAQIQRQGAAYVFFVDSVFNSSAEHVADICEAILRRGVTLKWGCFLRPANLTPDLMKLMARAGLAHIEFGSDSFCDEVLAAYGKRFTFDDTLHSSELAAREQIDYCHFLICGGPGETRATLAQGFANSQRLPGGVVLALVGMRVYPGTPLFEQARREGQLPTDADFLQPQYYLSPELTEVEVFDQLHEFSRQSPNWIVGDPPPEYVRMAEKLRARGVVGPLWSYFALLQRLRVPTFTSQQDEAATARPLSN